MSWSYEYFNISGYTTGDGVDDTGIQINQTLFLQVSGLKLDGDSLTNENLEYLTGLGFITSGITEISGSFYYDSDNQRWESVLSVSDAGEVGNKGTGSFEFDYNSGATSEHYATTSTGILVYANSAAQAWDTLTYKNESIDYADGLHTHAMSSALSGLSDVDIPASIDDGDVLMYESTSGGWTTGDVFSLPVVEDLPLTGDLLISGNITINRINFPSEDGVITVVASGDATLSLQGDYNNNDEDSHAYIECLQDGGVRQFWAGIGKGANDNNGFMQAYDTIDFYLGSTLGAGTKYMTLKSDGLQVTGNIYLDGSVDGIDLSSWSGQIDDYAVLSGDFVQVSGDFVQVSGDVADSISGISELAAENWRVFYSNSNNIVELALGTSGYALFSNGAASAPVFASIPAADGTGLGSLQEDPAPTLGANLQVGTYSIVASDSYVNFGDHIDMDAHEIIDIDAIRFRTLGENTIYVYDNDAKTLYIKNSDAGYDGHLDVEGNITAGGNIAVGGTVDGIDVADFKTDYDTVSGDYVVVSGAHSEVSGDYSTHQANVNAHHNREHHMTGTSDHKATIWKVFYSDGGGDINELSIGSSGLFLASIGATSAPTWSAAGGGGTVINDFSQGQCWNLGGWTEFNDYAYIANSDVSADNCFQFAVPETRTDWKIGYWFTNTVSTRVVSGHIYVKTAGHGETTTTLINGTALDLTCTTAYTNYLASSAAFTATGGENLWGWWHKDTDNGAGSLYFRGIILYHE